jgi:hypothetical protein
MASIFGTRFIPWPCSGIAASTASATSVLGASGVLGSKTQASIANV